MTAADLIDDLINTNQDLRSDIVDAGKQQGADLAVLGTDLAVLAEQENLVLRAMAEVAGLIANKEYGSAKLDEIYAWIDGCADPTDAYLMFGYAINMRKLQRYTRGEAV
jgi:hypothetical protein